MKSRGFTLIEIVVSIFIMGIMLFATHAIFLGTPLIQNARHHDLALKIASNQLEMQRGLGYNNLTGHPGSQSFSDTFLASLPSGVGTLIITALSTSTIQIEAQVSWLEQGTTTSISLATILAKTGGLP